MTIDEKIIKLRRPKIKPVSVKTEAQEIIGPKDCSVFIVENKIGLRINGVNTYFTPKLAFSLCSGLLLAASLCMDKTQGEPNGKS